MKFTDKHKICSSTSKVPFLGLIAFSWLCILLVGSACKSKLFTAASTRVANSVALGQIKFLSVSNNLQMLLSQHHKPIYPPLSDIQASKLYAISLTGHLICSKRILIESCNILPPNLITCIRCSYISIFSAFFLLIFFQSSPLYKKKIWRNGSFSVFFPFESFIKESLNIPSYYLTSFSWYTVNKCTICLSS